ISITALSILEVLDWFHRALSFALMPQSVSVTLFYGEDFHITLPSLQLEVTFQNMSAPRLGEVTLMRGGVVLSSRARVNAYQSHLVIDAVTEGDEGIYTIKNPDKTKDVRRKKLVVRDCSNEQNIKYGGDFRIMLTGVNSPITLEYRPIAVEANQTFKPALVLLTSTNMSREGYQGRISVSGGHVTLRAVTGADEGSYTVRDADGKIQIKLCLNVREHQNFVKLPNGEKLKIDLILNSSLIRLYYSPDRDPSPRLLLDKGALTSAPAELGFEDRLSMEDSLMVLDQVRAADAGQFKITDILGFTVSSIHLEIQPYKLETLYVTIIALLGLLVFLLLVCLLSCLIKVKKRAKRAAALEKIAQNAGKENEGEAFRQVVKNITKLSEHSQAENTEKSQSTEVDIKGLEVSSKEVGVNNLETSDSGVGFNTALPLDTDTDAPDPISESAAVTISVAPETKSGPPPEPKAAPSPADPKAAPSPSPEPLKAAPVPTAPTPESTLTPPPESPKPSTPEPITNGTPESGLDSKRSPDHLDTTGSPALKSAPPKTPELELKVSGTGVEASKDGALAEESSATT
uniref:Si:dkeyp-77h1.4 n=1 Tax=Takifugu rubripes TaxID=31033 RepID=H2U1W6_TAKRU